MTCFEPATHTMFWRRWRGRKPHRMVNVKASVLRIARWIDKIDRQMRKYTGTQKEEIQDAAAYGKNSLGRLMPAALYGGANEN